MVLDTGVLNTAEFICTTSVVIDQKCGVVGTYHIVWLLLNVWLQRPTVSLWAALSHVSVIGTHPYWLLSICKVNVDYLYKDLNTDQQKLSTFKSIGFSVFKVNISLNSWCLILQVYAF